MTSNHTLPETQPAHSAAWVTRPTSRSPCRCRPSALGIAYLPVRPVDAGFLAVAGLYSVTSAISLSKTVRDQHEARTSWPGSTRPSFEKLLIEHDPYKVASF